MKTKVFNRKNLLSSVVFSGAKIILMILVFAACSIEDSEYDKQVQRDDQAIEDYLNEKKIDAQKHPDGFWYVKLDASSGEIALNEGDVVSFYYTISLLNGTLIGELDPLTDEPAKVKLNSYSIIPVGLDNAIGMMKIGDSYRFYMPSYLSYGSYSTDKFSAYANFIIDIRVVKAETEAAIKQAQIDTIQNYLTIENSAFQKNETGLFYIPVTVGSGEQPNNVSRITFDFSRYYLNGDHIKTMTGQVIYLGNNQAVPGLDEGLQMMKEGGEAILYMPADLGFKQSLCIVPEELRRDLLDDQIISAEVKPYSIIKYDVKLITVN